MSMVLLLLISLSVGMAWQAKLGDRTAEQEGQTKKGARVDYSGNLTRTYAIIQCLPAVRTQMSKSAPCRRGGACLYSRTQEGVTDLDVETSLEYE